MSETDSMTPDDWQRLSSASIVAFSQKAIDNANRATEAARAEAVRLRGVMAALVTEWERGQLPLLSKGGASIANLLLVGVIKQTRDALDLANDPARRLVEMGNGEDDDVKAARVCPHCRNDLASHNRSVWEGGYGVGSRHQRESDELNSRRCRAEWSVGIESEYAGCHHCALPHGHGGPHVEAEHGWRWTNTGPAPVPEETR